MTTAGERNRSIAVAVVPDPLTASKKASRMASVLIMEKTSRSTVLPRPPTTEKTPLLRTNDSASRTKLVNTKCATAKNRDDTRSRLTTHRV